MSNPRISNWEDARAYVSDETGEVLLGLTAVKDTDDDHHQPVAATVRGEVMDGKFSIDTKSLAVYPNDKGKNVTPISPDSFLFRREENDRHTIEIAKDGTDENGQKKLEVIDTIHFPKKDWCDWQMGTTAQILPGGILPIHGSK